MVNLENLSININLIKNLFLVIATQITLLKIINDNNYFSFNKIIGYVCIIIIVPIVQAISNKTNVLTSTKVLIFGLSCIFAISMRENIGYVMLLTIISLACNYAIYFVAVIVVFFINSAIVILEKDFINLILIILIHIIILCKIFRMKRLKYGITTLQKNINNEYIEMIILNISIGILFIGVIFSNKEVVSISNAFWIFIIFATIMFITIQKSLQLYYKQKLLVQELNETKEELENTKKELKQVEEENLEFSKKSHTLAHRQKSLEHKIQELVTKTEISTEEAGEVKDRLKEIQKDLYKETATVELSKTEISEIDDMLKYMQSECIKNKIEFELQLAGNIHYMTNNLISKEDLEILLADHIKDAIIAINHTDNINRSILVRLGEIDGVYSLYIYDSGIEFEIETLKNLGKRPSTTHADEGGTGMGFMNTFDTLKKYKASLIINELSKPNKDNYTKVLIFKFDKKNEFKIISYRQEQMKKITK